MVKGLVCGTTNGSMMVLVGKFRLLVGLEDMMVKDLIDESSWDWNTHKIESIFNEMDMMLILSIPLSCVGL